MLRRLMHFGIVGLIVLIFAIIFVNQFYFIIKPGTRGLVVTLGTLEQKIFEPGFYFKMPFIQSSLYLNVQTQKIEKKTESASKDLQIVNSTIALNYSLDTKKIRNLYQNVGDNYMIETKLIEPAIQESVKASTAKFTAEELITKRQQVSTEMLRVLKEKLETNGILVLGINIVDYQFSAEFNKAIENKVRAEQEALAEKNVLEKIKYEAQQRIEKARGEAEAIRLKAQAEAEAIRIKTEAIRLQGGNDYVRLQWIDKWDGKMPTTSMGSNVPVMIDLTQ